jgi:HAMP domain-containing protein
MKLSEKFAALCAIIAALPLMIAAIVTVSALSSNIRTQALEQLKKEARSAANTYEKRLDAMRITAQQIAVDISNKALVSNESTDGSSTGGNHTTAWARLQDMLPRAQNEFNLDFLIVADTTGRVIARHNDKPGAGETLTTGEDKNPIVAKVISDANLIRNIAVSSAVVEQGERLTRLGLDNMAQVRAGNEVKISEALVIESCAPIFSAGRFVGVVLIGQMLNNYYAARPGANALQTPLVAEIRQVIQPAPDKEAGAVIALGEVIIASSIFASGSSDKPTLLGANHLSAAGDEVLTESKRNFALSWQPIKSFDGTQIGAIGVAVSADEIGNIGASLKFTLMMITLLAAVLAGGIGYLFGRYLSLRLNVLTDAAARMSVGELSAPVRDDSSGKQWIPELLLKDEISNLSTKLDEMRESFRQAIERLKKR